MCYLINKWKLFILFAQFCIAHFMFIRLVKWFLNTPTSNDTKSNWCNSNMGEGRDFQSKKNRNRLSVVETSVLHVNLISKNCTDFMSYTGKCRQWYVHTCTCTYVYMSKYLCFHQIYMYTMVCTCRFMYICIHVIKCVCFYQKR